MAVTLDTIAEGTIVKITENGVPQNFIVLRHGYPAAGRTLVLREDVHSAQNWYDPPISSVDNHNFFECNIDKWLNSTYINMIEAGTRAAISDVHLEGTVYRKAFILTVTEIGRGDLLKWQEGTYIPYFYNSSRRSAKMNGPLCDWLTRTHTQNWSASGGGSIPNHFFNVAKSGEPEQYYISKYGGGGYVRPAFTLPFNMLVHGDGLVTPNRAPTAPNGISVPGSIRGGTNITVSWGGSSDPDGNLAGYRLEHNVNGGGWGHIYQGGATAVTQAITKGWGNIAYRVKAYDTMGAESGYTTSGTVGIINNLAPGAPPSINVPGAIQGGTNITVSWGGASDPDGNLAGYRLERSVNGGAWAQVYQGAAVSSVQGITSGWRTIAFRVKAYDAEGLESGYRTSGTVTINTAPSVPGSISVPGAIKGGTSITVSWAASSDPEGNLSGYRLERSVDGGAWAQVYQGAAASSAQTITLGWKTIAFRVRAYDAGGLLSGYRTSGTVSINTEPAVPGSITLPEFLVGGETVTVSWAASTDPEGNLAGYRLERSVDGGAFAQVYQGANLSFDQVITVGWRTVAFRVKAYDSAGLESGYRTSITGTVNSAPSTPETITVPDIIRDLTTIAVSWTASGDPEDNLSGYRLERSVDGGTFEQVFQGPELVSEQAVAKGWATIQFRVKAYDAGGLESGYRESATVTIYNNQAPAAPDFIDCAPPPKVRKTTVLTCGVAVDPDGDAVRYVWEHSLDGGEYAELGVTDEPTISDTLPEERLTYRIRVKAVDEYGDASAYVESNLMDVIPNEPPTVPGRFTYVSPVREGRTVTMTCVASTDPDDDPFQYLWVRSIDGGAFTEFGRTDEPTISDTVPMGATTYQVRVKAVDSKGNESAFRTGAKQNVIPNFVPVISGADGDMGDQEALFQYRYTVRDEDPEDAVLAVTETLNWGDKSWLMRAYEANSGEENTFLIEPVWLELLGEVELVIEATDGLGAKAVRKITFTRVVNRMAAYRCFGTDAPVSKCIFGIDLKRIPESCDFTLEVCNNPFDAVPVWEEMSAKVNKAVHFFGNSTVETPGLAYRFIVTKGTETAVLEKIVVKYA